MKAIAEQIRLLPDESFRLLHWNDNVRDVEIIDTTGNAHPLKGTGDAWHLHHAMELVLITRGRGTRFVGDSIKTFKATELTLVGSTLPHHWQGNGRLSGYAIQFHFDSFHPFWKLKDTHELRPLWNRAQHGIIFSGRLVGEVARLIKSMPGKGGIGRFALLMQILDKLQHAPENNRQLLSKKNYSPSSSQSGYQGIQKAINLILNSFHENLSFAQVLRESAMSKATFERQFKKNTGKTFTQFLSEVRIDAASRQLLETDRSISEIAYASGFNNLSHFNRQFHLIHNQSPSAFRKRNA